MKLAIRISILLALLGLSSCKDEPPTKGCLICPRDFRLTDFEPAWSPDGTTIAYVHGDSTPATTGIYLINSDGTNIRLWHASAGASTPTWSPDNQWIAFSDGGQIFKKKVNGDSLTQLTSAGGNYFPDWSPDGLWIAYDNTNCGNATDPPPLNSCGILIMRNDGTEKRSLFVARMPSWNPDGKSLLGTIGASPTSIWKRFVRYFPFEIVQPETLDAAVGHDNRFPKYSPDGTKIAFTSQAENGLTQIWVINADGTNPQQLTTTQGYTCDWSPDGEWIVFTDSRSVSGRLWLMRKDGSEKQQLTFDEGGG